jgi:hypothetical protein
MVWLVYLIIYKPLESKQQFYLEVFNESCFLFTTYFLSAFSDANPSTEAKQFFGAVFYFVIMLMIAVNYTANIYELIKQKIRDKKIAKALKAREEAEE